MSGCGDSTISLNQAALDSLAGGDYGTAESKLMEAIKNRPVDRTLRRNLVEVYFRQEKWDEAIRLLKSTLTISGLESDLDLRSSLALAYTMSGENQRASAELRALLEEDPDNEFMLVLDGLTATAPQHAIASLKKAIEANPDRKESYFGLARAYTYAGEAEEARAALDKIVEKFGSSPDTTLYEVSLYLREDNIEMARQSLSKLLESDETSPTARLFEAYLALADRKVEEAQTLFESIEGDPEVASRAKLGQALCLLTLGDVNLAIELCDEVVEADPDEPVAYNLLGLGQLKRLQRFLAKKSFDKSLEIDPDQPAIQALVDRIASL
jgi:tetratricopeptide (TPR) repeat protein